MLELDDVSHRPISETLSGIRFYVIPGMHSTERLQKEKSPFSVLIVIRDHPVMKLHPDRSTILLSVLIF